MNLHAFVLLAEPNAVQQYVSIDISGKNIYPANYSTSAEINGICIPEFVLLTHVLVCYVLWVKMVRFYRRPPGL